MFEKSLREFMDEPWWVIDNKMSEAFNKELLKEITPTHILYGTKAVAVAKREDNDDVVYWVSDFDKYAVVHLTYTKENSPEYPKAQLFTLKELKEHCENISKSY